MVVGPSHFVTLKPLQRWATWMGTGTIKLCFLVVVQHMPTVLGVVARADHLARGKNITSIVAKYAQYLEALG